MAQVCFDSSTFYTVMIVGISTILYVIYNIYQQKLGMEQELVADAPPADAPPANAPPANAPPANAMLAAQVQRLEDMQRMSHPLSPPMRRGPFSYSAPSVTVPVNTPTRGEYGGFQQMGFLHNTADQDQAMPLMGRRIHSNQYEYYTFHHNNPQIKIPIKIKGDQEINDGDNVDVYSYGTPLEAKIYDLDAPRYIPY